MNRIVTLVVASTLIAGSALAAETPIPSVAPAAETAKAALEKSPRHGEYVDIALPEGGKVLRAWVSYPERKDKAPVVIVIHEIYGLSDWIRGVADQLAADGFLAIAPDFVSGLGPNGGGTDSVASSDDVVKLIRGLDREQVTTRLNAVKTYSATIKAATKKFATIGFCWGGGQSFAYATAQPDLDAAVVYYGSAPDTPTLAKIKAPVLGLYGGDDARVNATIPDAQAEMKKLGKTYEVHTYEGAGHGFLRQQDGREGANLKGAQSAWPTTIEFLKKHLE